MTRSSDWTKLTPEEKNHLINTGGLTEGQDLEAFFDAQDEIRAKYHMEPCWDCKSIARKLGFEPRNANDN